MIDKINWSGAIFFFDVDDTLFDTTANSYVAADSIYQVLKKEIGEEKSLLVKNKFKSVFKILADHHMGITNVDMEEYNRLIARITHLQKSVVKKFGSIRKWSREVFLKIAAESFDIDLKSELIYKAVDAYWNTISERSVPIKGVFEFFDEIKKHNRPVFLLTGSDARLQFDGAGSFSYDPQYSESFKRKRINALKNRGLYFNAVSIGDPEDKPHLDFFEKGIKTAEDDLNKKIETKNAVMFGDSYKADLQVPREELGFGLAVLFRKGQEKLIEEGEKYVSTGNLLLVKDYLL